MFSPMQEMERQAVEEIIELGLHARFNAKVLDSEGAHIRPPMQAHQRKEVDREEPRGVNE